VDSAWEYRPDAFGPILYLDQIATFSNFALILSYRPSIRLYMAHGIGSM
jgi:hypothetical protein